MLVFKQIIHSSLNKLRSLYISLKAENLQDSLSKLKHSSYDIVFYMSGGIDSKYQYDMWGPIISEMEARGLKVVTVFRSEIAYRSFNGYGECRAFARGIAQLIDLYSALKIKVILYPNNRMKNFQSLSYNDACHIFINHGESEKSSMFSNQVKAYDLVFIAGNIALDRYLNNLSRIDDNKFIKVGRPQLDFIEPKDIPIPPGKKVILYAPTWEGTHSEMNYSSVGREAYEMVDNMLNNEEAFVIYKPHPSIGIQSPTHKKYNEKIIDLLEGSNSGCHFRNGDINSIYHKVDFAIFDNSSVIIDYLPFSKPYCVINLFSVDRSTCIPELARDEFVLVSIEEMSMLYKSLDKKISNYDIELFSKIKSNYLGDLSKGESTDLFISKIKAQL